MLMINQKNEKKIRDFCKKVKNNLNESKYIKNEVEEELFENIKAKSLGYISEGVTPDVAVKSVLDEYESPKSVLEELSAEYKIKKTINNKFLLLSSLFLFIGISILSVFYYWNFYLLQNNFETATADVELIALKQLSNESTLPYLVVENPTIEAIWTKNFNENNQVNNTYAFPENLNLDINKFERTDTLFYETVFHGYVSDIGNKNYKIEMEIAQIHFKPLTFYIGSLILLLSLVLFIYWGISNFKYKYSNTLIKESIYS